MTTPDELLAAARWYAGLGWPLIPIAEGRNAPPIFQGWRDLATADPGIILGWWGTYRPRANIGRATDGVFVLDIDGRHDGPSSLRKLTAYHGPLPLTVTAKTPNGWHLHFTGTRPSITVSTGRIGPGLDVRSNGGYCILPPSVRPPDGRYRWLRGRSPDDLPLAETPTWLLDLAEPPAPTPPPCGPRPEITDRLAEHAFDGEIAAIEAACEGTRNADLYVSARKLGRFCAAGKLGWTDVRDALIAAAVRSGLDQKGARLTVMSGLRSRGWS
jgi:hypothetical protein